MELRRVVVTGIGTINPIGNNIEEYFRNLELGVSGAAPITNFDASNFKVRFACEVKNYDWSRYFDRKEVRKYDRFAQFALVAATEAVADAALGDDVNRRRCGVRVWAVSRPIFRSVWTMPREVNSLGLVHSLYLV